MTAFATITELQDRLEWTLNEDEQRIGTSALVDLSDDARGYAGQEWPTESDAPQMVKTMVLRAAQRFMRNPDSYTMSAAGDERVGWRDRGDRPEAGGAPEFTESEINLLRVIGGQVNSGFDAVPLSAWGTDYSTYQTVEGRVPAQWGKKFPLYSSDTSPW